MTMEATDDIKSLICESAFAHVNDDYLEHEYGHYSPDELQKADIETDHKRRVAALQLAAINFLKDCTVAEQQSWVLCYQHVDGDYAYKNV